MLQELDAILAGSVGGFSIMDNHPHLLLLRVDPATAKSWSADEVARRWFRLHPPQGSRRKPLPADQVELLLGERVLLETRFSHYSSWPAIKPR